MAVPAASRLPSRIVSKGDVDADPGWPQRLVRAATGLAEADTCRFHPGTGNSHQALRAVAGSAAGLDHAVAHEVRRVVHQFRVVTFVRILQA